MLSFRHSRYNQECKFRYLYKTKTVIGTVIDVIVRETEIRGDKKSGGDEKVGDVKAGEEWWRLVKSIVMRHG